MPHSALELMVLESVDAALAQVGAEVGVQAGNRHIDQIKLIVCMFLAVVCGWLQWAVIRGTTFRHLFSVSVGLALAVFQYGVTGMNSFWVASLGTYAMMRILPRERVAFPIFVFVFSCLSYIHIYRMFYDWMGWSQDNSTLQMILTCKLTSLAYNYQDSATLAKRKGEKEPLTAAEQEQDKFSLAVAPSLLEYYSYLAFFGSFMVGPVFEYTDYIRFIKRESEFSQIPCPIGRSLILIVQTFLCIAGFLFLFQYFYYTEMLKPEWDAHPYWYKIVYLNLAMIGCKLRYYTGFKFGEAGIVASGFGYQGYKEDKSINWDRARGACIRYSEFGSTTKLVIDNWNISVTLWLRRYVFNRLSSKSSSPMIRSSALHFTMIVSAFWHGFYPSYYICFFGFSMLTEVSKMAYQSDFSKVPFVKVLTPIAWFWMYTTENLNGIVFVQLGLRETLTALNAIYWGPYVVLGLAWLFFKTTGLHRKKRTGS